MACKMFDLKDTQKVQSCNQLQNRRETFAQKPFIVPQRKNSHEYKRSLLPLSKLLLQEKRQDFLWLKTSFYSSTVIFFSIYNKYIEC